MLSDGYTYINENGEVLNSARWFVYASPFVNGRAAIKYMENGKGYYGLIDRSGKQVMTYSPPYDMSINMTPTMLQLSIYGSGEEYYDLDGNRIYPTKEELAIADQPHYDANEYKKFDKYRSKYKSAKYCGKNLFLIKSVEIVTSDNESLFDFSYTFKGVLSTEENLFFLIGSGSRLGIVSSEGLLLIEPKYSQIKIVDGGAFLTIINNKEQALFSPDGKILAKSDNAALWATVNGCPVTLRSWELDHQIVPGDILMIYSPWDLTKPMSTANLKSLVSRYRPTTNERYKVDCVNHVKAAAANNSTLPIPAIWAFEEFATMHRTL